MSDGLSLCTALASNTERVRFGTSIQPIYTRHVQDFAQAASFIHETSGGRFDFGIGVSHAPAMDRLGVQTGKPLGDIRRFVADLQAVPRAGELPRIVLATLRKKMIALAEEISAGMVFANGARSHMAESLAVLSAEARDGERFFVGNMIPTVVSDDVDAAKARNRRTLASYAALPNYRAYWKEAGYVDEMAAVESGHRRQGIRPHPGVSFGPLAGRHHALRHAVASARGHRGLVRRRRQDADHRPILRQRRPVPSLRGVLRHLGVDAQAGFGASAHPVVPCGSGNGRKRDEQDSACADSGALHAPAGGPAAASRRMWPRHRRNRPRLPPRCP